ncbi:predicted protein [Histoplasma capsulatum var. duboisii H88]|uniref:Predicted protein n=1 Tax=Ajellomyces capsulatus (strain H88) TaxID=544711 RepID=F0UKJ1_AJEC8|nr:predicted protein [Histoplasma capsulatum var. duboisii H88]
MLDSGEANPVNLVQGSARAADRPRDHDSRILPRYGPSPPGRKERNQKEATSKTSDAAIETGPSGRSVDPVGRAAENETTRNSKRQQTPTVAPRPGDTRPQPLASSVANPCPGSRDPPVSMVRRPPQSPPDLAPFPKQRDHASLFRHAKRRMSGLNALCRCTLWRNAAPGNDDRYCILGVCIIRDATTQSPFQNPRVETVGSHESRSSLG